jgi:hypothetical protein
LTPQSNRRLTESWWCTARIASQKISATLVTSIFLHFVAASACGIEFGDDHLLEDALLDALHGRTG